MHVFTFISNKSKNIYGNCRLDEDGKVLTPEEILYRVSYFLLQLLLL